MLANWIKTIILFENAKKQAELFFSLKLIDKSNKTTNKNNYFPITAKC